MRQVAPLDDATWHAICADWPIFGRLPSIEAADLRSMSSAFLSSKYLEGVQGMVLNAIQERVIALFACLPVLHLGLDWYKDWNNIFVTPSGFTDTRRDYRAGGVVTEWEEELSGEVFELGPVVLSWDDVRQAGQGRGYNVVIHEMAHKLDGRNGHNLDAMPPLDHESQILWKAAFTPAFHEFCQQVEDAERGVAATERTRLARLPLDEYAAESPAEFFAVACEAFFERPLRIKATWPEVYNCLASFFKQDPAAW